MGKLITFDHFLEFLCEPRLSCTIHDNKPFFAEYDTYSERIIIRTKKGMDEHENPKDYEGYLKDCDLSHYEEALEIFNKTKSLKISDNDKLLAEEKEGKTSRVFTYTIPLIQDCLYHDRQRKAKEGILEVLTS
jgi:hypothetical protein